MFFHIDVIDRHTLHDAIAARAFVVFGDNMARRGRGGQAKHARGHPAAIGIPTKCAPYDYLRDSDYQDWLAVVLPIFGQLHDALDSGVHIWWPSAGIGTGRAKLRTKAPTIWFELGLRKDALVDHARRLSTHPDAPMPR